MIYINATNSFYTRAKTGIQRVVRELGRRLNTDPACQLVVLHEGSFHILQDDKEVIAFMEARPFTPRHRIELTEFKAGDVFFDIDASWSDPCRVGPLWQALKRQKCILVKMHYDAVPILFPQYSHENTVYRYIENFSAALRYMDHWICNSRTVERDLHRIVQDMGMGDVSTHVCPLGADIHATEQERPPAPFAKTAPEKYIISVGTIEPRKNHDLVLDAFESLVETPAFFDTHLVLVGKSGWNNKRIVDRICNHPELGYRLHWFAGIPDAELAWLYRHAQVCLCLSHYEGFGLPVIEALSRGLPVIYTQDSAMEEVAGGAGVGVPLDLQAVTAALKKDLSESGQRAPMNYRATSWDEAAERMRMIFADILDTTTLSNPPHQVVYISVRPDSLLRSLQSVERHMPFIDEAVILTSDKQFDVMLEALQGLEIRTTLLNEREIGLDELPDDHQERNTLLRTHLYNQDVVDDNFIACDDDYRAIQSIDLSVFMEAGRHKAYFFYEDGLDWLGAIPPTSFDVGVWKTTDYLRSSGFDTRLYNAHQPQIVNKRLVLETFKRTRGLGCDEWSSYFNIAKHLKPGMFEDVIYRTGGWPGSGASWLPSYCPNDVLFFNDLPEGSDALEAAREWQSELKQAITRAASIRPNLPCFIVESGRARFTESDITCPVGYNLCIPILSDSKISHIDYEFLGRKVKLKAPIPNFLHVPIPHTAVGQFLTVKVAIVCKGVTCTEALNIRVCDGMP